MKRILAMVVCVAILATVAITGSIAYFTDSDEATNVFTVGNVVIEQHEQKRNGNILEELNTNTDGQRDLGKLYPMVEKKDKSEWSDMPGDTGIQLRNTDRWKNYVDKIVTVKNTGKSEAYVRNIVAIPTGNVDLETVPWLEVDWFDAEKKSSDVWTKSAPIKGATIDGVTYDIYVINYKTTLAPGTTTLPTLLGVGLSKDVDCKTDADGNTTYYYKNTNENTNGTPTDITLDLTEEMKIYVATQAVQADGFPDADAAFNATFKEVTAAIFGGTGGSTGGEGGSTGEGGEGEGNTGSDGNETGNESSGSTSEGETKNCKYLDKNEQEQPCSWQYLRANNLVTVEDYKKFDPSTGQNVDVKDEKTGKTLKALTKIDPSITELYVDGSAVDVINTAQYNNGNIVGNSTLKILTVGEGVKKIADGAFKNYTALTTVTLPDSLTYIGYSAFDGCASPETDDQKPGGLTTITIPSKVTYIGSQAFRGCTKLEEADLSAATGLTEICSNTFEKCTKLTTVKLPSSVTNIVGSAFWNCTSLTTIDLTNCTELTTIKGITFWDCTSLQTVKLPKRITTIEDKAFEGCSSLGTVYIDRLKSEGEVTIASDAFEGCPSTLVISYKTSS